MTEWHGDDGDGGTPNAPVFGWMWPEKVPGGGPNTETGLPLVWITQQVVEPQDGRTGRRCVYCYDPEDDPAGDFALGSGADYYNEAMSCDWRTERRVECFPAAEVLYLHASRLGNAMADDDLTYVYSYDRCEGNYWDSVAAGAKFPRPEERLSIAERAFAHCRVAAEAGIAESCYKLGTSCATVEGAIRTRIRRTSGIAGPTTWGKATLPCTGEALPCGWGRRTRKARAAPRASRRQRAGTLAPWPGFPLPCVKGSRGIATPSRTPRRALRERSRRFRGSTKGTTSKHRTMLLARHNLCPSCHQKGEGEL